MRRSTRTQRGSTEKSVSPAPVKSRKRKVPETEEFNEGGASDATDTTDVSCSSLLSSLSKVSFKKAFVKLRSVMTIPQATSQINVTLEKKLPKKKILEQFNNKDLETPINIRINNEAIIFDFKTSLEAEKVMKAYKGCFLSPKKNMEYVSAEKEDNKLEVRNIKRMNIVKGGLASVALSISNPTASVIGNQCSVVSIDEHMEVQNRVVTIGNKGGFSVSVRNTGTMTVKLPAGALWGYAIIIPDIELELPVPKSNLEFTPPGKQSDDDNGPEDDIDRYLDSSEDEEKKEEEQVKKTRSSANSDTLNIKAKVTFCEPKEMITSLDEFKKRINIFDQDSCITGTSTPEIMKTTATNEFMTELKESLDKSFDAVSDFLINDDIDNIEEDILLPADNQMMTPLQNPKITTVQKPQPIQRHYKKRSDFKEKKLSVKDPLLPQLKTLAKLLQPIPISEDLEEHFPGLFGQDHLAPVCETLVKYSKFLESSISFELSDFGDKLVCELSSMAQSDLDGLKSGISEINSAQPNASLDDWIRLFAEKFENFQNINDLLGDDFDMKAVQIVLLYFVPELYIDVQNEKEPLTSLEKIMVTVPIPFNENLDIPSSNEIRKDKIISDETVLELFNIDRFRDKIFIGVKTGQDDNIMIIDNDRPAFVKLQNIFQQSLLSHVDDEDIYLISLSDLLSPQCELAVSLSSWNLGTSSLFKTSFILYQSSASEYEVALVEGEKISTILMDRKRIKMLDDIDQRNVLKPGTELKLIMKSSNNVLLGFLNPDGKCWDILETTNLKITFSEIEQCMKNIDSFENVSYENDRTFLLMKSSGKKAIFDAQRALLKKSQILKMQNSKRHSVTLAPTFQSSKRELFTLRHVLNVSDTNIKLTKNLIKVVGDNQEKVQIASKIITFNLSRNRKNMINSSREFIEYSFCKNIAIKQNETKDFELQLRAGVSMQEYDAHVHFEFRHFSEKLNPTITQTSDKCIKLHLRNLSQNTIEMPAEQNVILLARKEIEKSLPY